MSTSFHFNPVLAKLKRGPQVMLPKDIGLVLAFSGVGRESVVVDAGAGSGFMATSLGNVCKKVFTYEKRPEFAKLARQNITRAGLGNIEIKEKDVFEGIDESEVDLVMLDLAEAEKAVAHAAKALKKGGCIVGYLPHAEQVTAFVKALNENGFESIFTLESIVREMLVRERGFRPDNTGLTHTAYLTFAKKK